MLRVRHRAPASLPQFSRGKLRPKFYGPYKVIAVVNKVAYRLKLPSSARIHDVFHVGLLKPFKGTPPSQPPALPPMHHGVAQPMPTAAVKMRMARGIHQILIQWVDQPASAATWEDLHSFRERYLHFQLEDKLLVEGGEMLYRRPPADNRALRSRGPAPPLLLLPPQRRRNSGQYKVSDLKIIPLAFYDLIIGMELLEQYSPMKVHWGLKWLHIPVKGKLVQLQGILPDSQDVPVGTEDEPQFLFASVPEPIQSLLNEFADVFEAPTALPPSRACDHSIPLVPVNIRPYRYTPAMKDEIEKQVHEMLSSGVIQPSSSAFCSLVLLVKKKDHYWRFCVDYRHLNALTVKTQYPVPVIDELEQASWFSSLDLRAGYHQVLLKAEEEFKTAFQTHSGHYEFRVMAFGLSGAPATFQGAMNSTLTPVLRKCVLVFFDDIWVYSSSLEDHICHLRRVLELLQTEEPITELVGSCFLHTLFRFHFPENRNSKRTKEPNRTEEPNAQAYQGVGTDPAKIEAIMSWHVPTNVKELRSFLGLAGYYRKFVRHFGVISQPLNALLKKHTVFVWTEEHDVAFIALKHALVSAPVLGLPNFAKSFCIETDASGVGIGAVLLQDGHPLAYISKALSPKHRGLSTYEKEYLAILLGVEQWRCYLQHGEFLIYTDHHCLSHLNEQRLHTPWQQKVFTKLLGLQYRIVYKKGTENHVADALSRRHHEQHQCLAISSSVPVWMDSVISNYQQDPIAQDLLSKLSVDPDAAKPDRSKLPGLLQTLDIPPSAWHTVSMDFVEGLPRSSSANCILVMVDKFTKYAHFIALLHPFSAQKIAKVFLQSVYKLHGMPVSIISDRDRIFTSTFWRELFKLAGVTLNMSLAYHPQSDRQTERVNQCLETYLDALYILVLTNGLSGWPLRSFGITLVCSLPLGLLLLRRCTAILLAILDWIFQSVLVIWSFLSGCKKGS
ncbi:hypothetical protein U9M48_036717 [Paspalum notatum var. saurae]|uniref:Integrase catalytic domain-containing protein n=1 Tax=Paspalum notatum var. saurae TaxID=547442 RepID=A0AAQ3X8J4_PASNO